jgi:uncharacterized protein (UPF0335 family)
MNAVTQTAKEQLRSFVERIERLEEEKAAIGEDVKELFAQAKSTGFDVKALKAIIRLRKQDPDDRSEYENALVTYMHALEMQSSMFDMEGFAALPRGDTEPLNDEIAGEFRRNGLLAAE